MDLLVSLDPVRYSKFVVTTKSGHQIIYMILVRDLYGIRQAAILFYKNLTNDLKTYGFQINDKDPCVSKKDIDGYQMTAIWHVNDIKISHPNPISASTFINWLRTKYETDDSKMKVV